MTSTLTVVQPEQGEFAWSITLGPQHPRNADTARQIQGVLAQTHTHASARAEEAAPNQEPTAKSAQLWIEQTGPDDDEFAKKLGFHPYRDLWRMQRPLPVETPLSTPFPTRSFRPNTADETEFLTVNNRAFHWHPEQGGLTSQDLAERMAEDWFDAQGFRLYEHDGRLAGFCWTKIHPDETPPGGEIYAIAIDPDFHGQGLGKPMTLAGLDYLATQGLTVGFLYVESDNHAAVATYHSLGFDHHATNRAYRQELSG